MDSDTDVETVMDSDTDVEKEYENLDNQASVRRLSLFDTLEENSSTNSQITSNNSDLKTEPKFNDQNEDSFIQDSDPKLGEEYSGEISDKDEDFNQESEEELLDIPTFLRRQAN